MATGTSTGTIPIDPHRRIVGWLHVGFGVVSIGVTLGLAGGVLFSWLNHRDAASGLILTMIICGLAIALAALPVLEIVGGVRLLRGQPGARALVTVFSVIHLPNVPLGTAAGAYSLWVLWRAPVRPPAVDAPRRPEDGRRS